MADFRTLEIAMELTFPTEASGWSSRQINQGEAEPVATTNN